MAKHELRALRTTIDEIDREIIRLLEERMSLCREIAKIKLELGLPIINHNREELVIARAGVFKNIFREIIKLCKEVQEEVYR